MRLWIVAAFISLAAGTSLASNQTETGYRAEGSSPATTEGQCGTLLFNGDGTYENAFAWQYGGTVAPDFGAFAEQYNVSNQPVCSLLLDLTQTGGAPGATFDAYLWDSYEGEPGLVLAMIPDLLTGPIAFWPSISRHVIDFNVENCPVGEMWAGYWGNWPDAVASWFVGADLDGFGGNPYTNIAPGIGYPTGWNDVSIVWGPTQAIGIGLEFADNSFCDIFPAACCLPDGSCYVTDDPYDCRIQGGVFLPDRECDPDPCGTTPTRESSWGQIKSLYAR